MSTQPTVAALATRATSLVSGLTEELAKVFIRNNNIRSNTKLDTMVKEQLAGKTEDELKTICAPVAAQRAEVAAKKKPAAKKAAAKPAAKKTAAGKDKPKFEKQGRAPRKTASPVTEGPRGFRFGPTWCESVKAGEGIALLEVHRNKLLKHAETMGVPQSVIDTGDATKIAKSLAAKIEKAEASAE